MGKTSSTAEVKWTYASTTSFSTFHVTTDTLTVNFWDNSANKIYSYTMSNPNIDYTRPFVNDGSPTSNPDPDHESEPNTPLDTPTSIPTSEPTSQPSLAPTRNNQTVIDRILNYHQSQRYYAAMVMGFIAIFVAGVAWSSKQSRTKFDTPLGRFTSSNKEDQYKTEESRRLTNGQEPQRELEYYEDTESERTNNKMTISTDTRSLDYSSNYSTLLNTKYDSHETGSSSSGNDGGSYSSSEFNNETGNVAGSGSGSDTYSNGIENGNENESSLILSRSSDSDYGGPSSSSSSTTDSSEFFYFDKSL